MPDILVGFFASVAAIGLPVLVAFAGTPALRRNTFFAVGPLTAICVVVFCASAAAMHKVPIGEPTRSVFQLSVAIFLVTVAGRYWSPELTTSQDFPRISGKRLIPVGLLALVAILDCFAIFAAQGWGIDGRVPYFHSPLQLDPRRTTDIVTALARDADTLFLPKSWLVYQIFWHHGAASVLRWLPASASSYHYVAGIGLTASFLMYAGLFWLTVLFRPGIRWLSITGLLVFVLAAAEGQVGAFANWLVIKGYDQFSLVSSTLAPFQYFSLKLLALTAPQHAMYVGLIAIFVGLRLQSQTGAITLLSMLLCVGLILMSPLLAILSLPFYFGAEIVVRRPPLRTLSSIMVSCAAIALIAIVLHSLLLRFGIWQLFMRHDAANPSFIWRDGLPSLTATSVLFAFVGSNGALGIAFTIILAALCVSSLYSWREEKERWIWVLVIALLGGFAAWNFLITEIELRRHYSMIASALMLLIIGAVLAAPSRPMRLAIALSIPVVLATMIGVSIHVYMVRGYVGGDSSSVSFNTPWGDYLAMNRYIQEHRPDAAVVAASGEGMELPLVNEAAVSLAPRLAIFAHQKMSESDLLFLGGGVYKDKVYAAELTSDWRRRAIAAGFDTVEWGPIEEEVWGIAGREHLLKGATLLARRGRVALFALSSGSSSSTPFDVTDFLNNSKCEQVSQSRIGKAGYHLEWRDGIYRVILPSTMALVASGPRLQDLWENLGRETCDARATLPILVEPTSATIDSSEIAHRLLRIANKTQSSTVGNIGVATGSDISIHTEVETGPWLQIDLGVSTSIQEIRLFAEKQARRFPMQNIIISISDEQFPLSFDPLGYYRGVTSFFVDGLLEGEISLAVPAQGRFIRFTIPGVGQILADHLMVLN